MYSSNMKPMQTQKCSNQLEKNRNNSQSRNKIPIPPKDEELSMNKLTQSKYQPIRQYSFDFQQANKNQKYPSIYSNQISSNQPIQLNFRDISTDSADTPQQLCLSLNSQNSANFQHFDQTAVLKAENASLQKEIQSLKGELARSKESNQRRQEGFIPQEPTKNDKQHPQQQSQIEFYQQENVMLREKFSLQDSKMNVFKQQMIRNLDSEMCEKLLQFLQ